ncbi:NF038215 family lipoprotein [Acinetobacter ursingii]|uniref:NF038215 family lipoprotein n=1 Tax=Acinetobacter ursingii TaxID=108980 RepID=UPI0021CD8DD3|nr:NF038215 family lipoprotein [Acinetobacter ursingii]MCU4481128.1 NF038215 family lipoprotein [Acinetobacter ursingii]MCU4505457.1 NF038215 family lipoprotein [Acinetobacter ursingii]MCU4569538.1 NF038215 family lipoprotein [Acinetobacter ursingii]
MKRMFLYVLVVSSSVAVMGCDMRAKVQNESIQSSTSARSMSIAGMPVYDKDFKLAPLLANDTHLKQNQ